MGGGGVGGWNGVTFSCCHGNALFLSAATPKISSHAYVGGDPRFLTCDTVFDMSRARSDVKMSSGRTDRRRSRRLPIMQFGRSRAPSRRPLHCGMLSRRNATYYYCEHFPISRTVHIVFDRYFSRSNVFITRTTLRPHTTAIDFFLSAPPTYMFHCCIFIQCT